MSGRRRGQRAKTARTRAADLSAGAATPNLPAVVPPGRAGTTPPRDAHRHAAVDRSVMANLARATAGLSPHAMIDAWSDWALHMARAPGRQMELAERAGANWLRLSRFALSALSGKDAEKPFLPGPHDTRWSHPGWDATPFALWQQGFLGAQDWWQAATADLPGLRKQNAERVGFMVRQLLDTVSPANFPPLNPEIIARTRDTAGRNLVEGAAHFADDAVHVLAQEHRPVPEAFALGKVLAATPGTVVFRNDLMELIQYAPATERVRPEPVLIVPAWIMKYYILDLSAHNSLVAWLLEQGFTVFMISWRNPGPEDRDLGMDAYLEQGPLAALEAVRAITGAASGSGRVHAAGYCLGGTLLAAAAALLARRGDERLASLTLFAAQVDFTEPGELMLFISEGQVALLEDMMWQQGYLRADQMAGAFTMLRPGDLLWSRLVREYMMGERTQPSDLMVWNADTTRMPCRMHSEYLRWLFLENRLAAGRYEALGERVSLTDLRLPICAVGTESDHVAPWRSVYKIQRLTETETTFILTSGGHNAGIVSEPGHPRRRFRIATTGRDDPFRDADTWLAETPAQPGSWWPAWAAWLAARSGPKGAVPPMGPLLAPAPGDYVRQG